MGSLGEKEAWSGNLWSGNTHWVVLWLDNTLRTPYNIAKIAVYLLQSQVSRVLQ